jgi:hypothetical protein
MTEDEDRLRELLRAPLPGASRDAEPVRLELARAVGRLGRLTTISTVIVTVALIAVAVAAFRVTANRPQPDASGAQASSTATHAARVPPTDVLARDIPCSGHHRLSGPAQLQGFHPVIALRCADVVGGDAVSRTRDVTDGPLTALLAGLERRDGVPPADTVCATYLDMQPQLVLVDESGNYLRPRFPRDGCGHIHGTPAYEAYLDLVWRSVSQTRMSVHHRVR